jgi:hypothetical protein
MAKKCTMCFGKKPCKFKERVLIIIVSESPKNSEVIIHICHFWRIGLERTLYENLQRGGGFVWN